MHEERARLDPTIHANVRTGRDPVCTFHSTVLYQSLASVVWEHWDEGWAEQYHAWLPRNENNEYYLPPAPELQTFLDY